MSLYCATLPTSESSLMCNPAKPLLGTSLLVSLAPYSSLLKLVRMLLNSGSAPTIQHRRRIYKGSVSPLSIRYSPASSCVGFGAQNSGNMSILVQRGQKSITMHTVKGDLLTAGWLVG